MEAINMMKTRRSVRKFTDEVVSKETIEEIIDVARMAPSWKNTQTLRYVIVQNKEKIEKLKECMLDFEFNIKTLSGANTVTILTQVNGRCGYERDGSFSTSKGSGWEMFDAGIAAYSFCLAAHEKGVGTVIMGIFDDKKVAEVIGLPDDQTVVAVIPTGIPKYEVEPTPRKEVADLVKFI